MVTKYVTLTQQYGMYNHLLNGETNIGYIHDHLYFDIITTKMCYCSSCDFTFPCVQVYNLNGRYLKENNYVNLNLYDESDQITTQSVKIKLCFDLSLH